MSSLPISSVNEIFSTMSVTYGAAWAQMWIGMDFDEVVRKWSEELGFLIDRPDCILHALSHLPVDKPPNILQFKVICLGAPAPATQPQLPSMPPAKPDISRLRAAFMRLKELREARRTRPKQWAYDLQESERLGGALTEGQRKAWRAALSGVSEREAGSTPSLIDVDCLPPGMRDDAIQAGLKRSAR